MIDSIILTVNHRDMFRFAFELKTSAKTLYLAACSSRELKAWLDGLQKVLLSNVQPPSLSPSPEKQANMRAAPSKNTPRALMPKSKRAARAILVGETKPDEMGVDLTHSDAPTPTR